MQIMLSTYAGGTERYFVDLYNEQSRSNNEVIAVCDERFKLLKQLNQGANHEIVCLKFRNNFDPLAAYKLWRVIKKSRPDIIHAHLGRATRIVGPIARLEYIPTVATAHIYFRLKHYRFINHIIATTGDLKKHCRALGFGDSQISVIHAFSRRLPAADNNLKRFRREEPVKWLSFGRFTYHKGFDLLIDAFHALLESRPDDTLVLGGEGPEMDRLREQVRRLGIEQNVHFSGWLEDVSSALGKADIFVLPSRHEAFGLVILESMAHGVPVVSSAAEGPKEFLDKKISWLCEPGNKQDLINTMLSAVNNPERSLTMAKTALRRYKQHYYAPVVVPEITTAYEHVLSNRQ